MDYRSPASVREALDLLAAHGGGAQVLAGGTDLLVKLRGGYVAPKVVVDVKAIPQLRGIGEDARGFRIGAATACAEIGEHAALAAAWPGVVEALQLIGSTQIQGRATLGGNLCNASPAADSVPAMIAAGATCEVAGPAGEREVPVESIITGSHASTGPAAPSPRLSDPWPYWNIQTITPNDAPAATRFIAAAASGTRSERKASISSRKPSPTTTPTNSGIFCFITVAKSSKIAVVPPT